MRYLPPGMGAEAMAKNLSLGDFFPVSSGEVREAVPDYYRDDFEEGAPMDMRYCHGLAKSLEAGAARLLTAARSDAAEGGPGNLDELIEGLERLEENASALFSPFLRRAEAAGASWAEPLIRALESLRDCRWQMMVLRADTDREDAAPTFSDAGTLRKLIDGL